MTQAELADHIGRKKNTVSRWEVGKTSPDADDLIAICQLLNVTPCWLLFGQVALIDTARVEALDAAKSLNPTYWRQHQTVAVALSENVRISTKEELDEALRTVELRRLALQIDAEGEGSDPT